MVAKENELRLSTEWQRKFEAAERRADTDWLECVADLQLQVVREFEWPDATVHALRTARSIFPDDPFFSDVPIYVRFNRARNGPLAQGASVPREVPLHCLDGSVVPLLSFGGEDVPLVIVAGSFS
mmetsp:Transcript_139231/g.445024  ORF Transcript_139231/g.445024 Transcript_139231/m.445024 type:complete len:125 (+) Transcript_139231:1278-1652(+)